MTLFSKNKVLINSCCVFLILLSTNLNARPQCIGVILAGVSKTNGDFWGQVSDGAYKAARELSIEVYLRGTIDELNINGQQFLTKLVQKRGCKGLVITPNSNVRAIDVARLKTIGIPTVYIDRKMEGDVVSVIKTNNFAAGELAGRNMVKKLKGRGTIALFRLENDVVSSRDRVAGFLKQVTSAGMKVGLDQILSTDLSIARLTTNQVLQDRDDIDAIFTPNEMTSLSVLKTLQSLDNTRDIVHIGFDSAKKIIQALHNRKMYGFVMQQPYMMGYLGVKTVYQAMHGKKVDPNIETPVLFVTLDNIHEITPDILEP